MATTTEAALRAAIDDHLHAIDCGEALFGDNRCRRCAAVHDSACGNVDPTLPHSDRWCSGNTYGVTLQRIREAVR